MAIYTTDTALPVQQQLDAYNARDIEVFMPWWADDCRYYAFPDQLLAEGAAAIRARPVERFREPNLHGRLVGRSVVGNVVVDREVVTRTFPDGPARWTCWRSTRSSTAGSRAPGSRWENRGWAPPTSPRCARRRRRMPRQYGP